LNRVDIPALVRLAGKGLALVLTLADNADAKGQTDALSIEAIAARADLSRSSVCAQIASLEAAGVLDQVRTGRASRFVLRLPLTSRVLHNAYYRTLTMLL
jgi:DNA-binding IclR family transcriptional regulator